MFYFFKKIGKIAPFLLSFSIIAYLFLQIDLSSIINQMKLIPLYVFFIVFFINILTVFIVSFRFWRILTHFGFFPTWIKAFRASVLGLVSSLFLFSLLGTILGRQVILQREGVSVPALAAITTYERILLAAVGGFLCFIGALVIYGRVETIHVFDQVPISFIGVAILTSFFFGYSFSRSRYEKKLLKSLFSFKVIIGIAETISITFVSQILSILAFVILMVSIKGSEHLFQFFAAAAIVSFVASIPISVNGWGVREVAAVYVFGTLGLSPPESAAIAVLVGLCSMLVVAFFAPVIAVLQRNRSTSVGVEDKELNKNYDITLKKFDQEITKTERGIYLILGLSLSILLFFQLKISFFDNVITVNMADPIAVISFIIFILSWISNAQFKRPLPFIVSLWFFAVTIVLITSYLLGLERFGGTSWALYNRLLGWPVLLGYFACGVLFVRAWGNNGLRRLCEAVVVTAVSIVVITLIGKVLEPLLGTGLSNSTNFNGFSGNRNTFSLQLVLSICCLFVVSSLKRRAYNEWVWSVCLGILLFGVFQTISKAGMVVLIGVSVLSIFLNLVDRRIFLYGLIVLSILLFLNWGVASVVPPAIYPMPQINVINVVNQFGNGERIYSLLGGLALWQEYPLWGAGLGAFIGQEVAAGNAPLVIHSTIVWILAECGSIGTIIILTMPIYGLYKVIKLPSVIQTLAGKLLFLSVLSLAIFGLVHEIAYHRLFWFLFGATIPALMSRRWIADAPSTDVPIKVMHVITSLNRGGAETMLTELVATRDPGVSPTVVCLISGGVLVQTIRARNQLVPVHELGFKYSVPNPYGIWRLVKLIRAERPDIIQGWMYHGDLIALIALYLSGRRSVTKLFWGIRCSDMNLTMYSWQLRLTVLLCAFLSSLPDSVIANSDAGRRAHLRLGYNPEHFNIVHNGINTDRFKPNPNARRIMRAALGIRENERVICHVARVDPMKDHAGLLASISDVPDLRLILIGTGTQNLELPKNAIALGARQDIESVLPVGDGIISSSAYGEGFSNALAEGMACGLMPIATNVGDSQTIVGDVGWIIPPSNSSAMTAAFQRFLDLPEDELRDYCEKASARINQVFTLPVSSAAFKQTYWSVTKHPKLKPLDLATSLEG